MSMEDSFRVRVDKAFGNLGNKTPSSVDGDGPSLWCLTDDEIERREWNRSKGVAEDGEEKGGESGPSIVRNNLVSDFKELSDYEEEEEEDDVEIDGEEKRRRNNSGSAEAGDDEFLDVQSNIGRDCTLDYEEEEDEYDKVAVCMENTGDRLYMRNVKHADHEIHGVNGYGELPNTFEAFIRDPRANHEAAKIRLREDSVAAGDIDTLQLSDNSMAAHSENEDHKRWELDVDNPKPILKRRENLMDSRPRKRVKFMVDPKSSVHEGQYSTGASDLTSEPHTMNQSAVPEQASDQLSQYSTGVPDYVRNPSKYTRYTFDSSSDDMNDESNRTAYADLFDYLRKRNTDISQEDTSVEIPNSILFTAKKKPEHDSTAKSNAGEHKTKGNLENKSWSVGITAEDTVESEVSAMEEDEPGLPADEGACGLRKSGRQYRTRINVDSDDNLD